jgi:hypothetical protein
MTAVGHADCRRCNGADQGPPDAAEITESIVTNTGTAAEYVYVIFEDVAPSDRAGAGKLFGAAAEKI